MSVELFLDFNGKCEEALTYYQSLFGIEVSMLMRYEDSPEPEQCPANSQQKIMHANFKIGDTTFMASDGECLGEPNFSGFSLSLNISNEEQGTLILNSLAEQGSIIKPLSSSLWGGLFGSVKDRYGLTWMISVLP